MSGARCPRRNVLFSVTKTSAPWHCDAACLVRPLAAGCAPWRYGARTIAAALLMPRIWIIHSTVAALVGCHDRSSAAHLCTRERLAATAVWTMAPTRRVTALALRETHVAAACRSAWAAKGSTTGHDHQRAFEGACRPAAVHAAAGRELVRAAVSTCAARTAQLDALLDLAGAIIGAGRAASFSGRVGATVVSRASTRSLPMVGVAGFCSEATDRSRVGWT